LPGRIQTRGLAYRRNVAGRKNELTQSHAHGVSMTPLIGETIGVHFDQAAERPARA
jgi:hypothetical protein